MVRHLITAHFSESISSASISSTPVQSQINPSDCISKLEEIATTVVKQGIESMRVFQKTNLSPAISVNALIKKLSLHVHV